MHDPAAEYHDVVIIGAGLAGMSAALRLLERGYDVTLYEQDDFVGGMLRAYENDTTGVRSEHIRFDRFIPPREGSDGRWSFALPLTAEGQELAKDVVRRHETLKDFFVKILLIDDEEAFRVEQVGDAAGASQFAAV